MIELMPAWFWVVVMAVFGLIIGSFLNVVIYRFHTGKSLNGHSHCLSCLKKLSWYELVPVLSYVLLRARCADCGSFIPVRYVLVEILTAISFVVVWLQGFGLLATLLLLTLVSVLIVGLVYDLYHLIIPDEVSVTVAGLGFVWILLGEGTMQILLERVPTALAISLCFASIWFISKGRAMGLGDAKLVFGLGLFLSLSENFSLVVLSFWIGAIISVGLLLLGNISEWLYRRNRLPKKLRVKMKSEIPFAPFMVIAFFLVFFLNANVLDWSVYATQIIYSYF